MCCITFNLWTNPNRGFKNQFELEELGKEYAITDLNVIIDHCEVEYVLNDNTLPPNTSTNIYIIQLIHDGEYSAKSSKNIKTRHEIKQAWH